MDTRGIVEEEHAGGVVDGPCRVHARRNARPSALGKALHDGVVNLQGASSEAMHEQCEEHVYELKSTSSCSGQHMHMHGDERIKIRTYVRIGLISIIFIY